MTVSIITENTKILRSAYSTSQIHPSLTLIPVGQQMSSLFTTTAVLQLVQSKRLKMEDLVSDFFKFNCSDSRHTVFKMPPFCQSEVTILHLLTHTAGLEHRSFQPGEHTFGEQFPRIVHPPGKIYSYSPHGLALLGKIVSMVTGMPFDKYVEEKIFLPLGMLNTGFIAPNSDSKLLKKFNQSTTSTSSAKPHQHLFTPHSIKSDTFSKSETFEATKFDINDNFGWFSTVSDMNLFMEASLNKGAAGNSDSHLYGSVPKRILEEPFADLMQTPHKSHTKSLSICLGYYETVIKNTPILFKTSEATGSSHIMAILPDEYIGFYAATNSNNPKYLWEVLEEFILTYVDGRAEEKKRTIDATDELKFDLEDSEFLGTYRLTSTSYTNYESFFSLFSQAQVYKSGESLGIDLPFSGSFYIKKTTGNGSFLMDDGTQLTFKRYAGQVRYVFTEDSEHNPVTFERVDYDSASVFLISAVSIFVIIYEIFQGDRDMDASFLKFLIFFNCVSQSLFIALGLPLMWLTHGERFFNLLPILKKVFILPVISQFLTLAGSIALLFFGRLEKKSVWHFLVLICCFRLCLYEIQFDLTFFDLPLH
ncbi:hypothetical protein HK099_005268 [Clydaea vesicula]|uniref:Beta-lactamase-related domain-containing protein n=1 Tax=Clydaea vesicula TaxID=447962 RepID=A0AAD5U6N3_9FUNG|nr:hypothetical protein HK099_005268 [Clydaea vesicula]